MTNDADDVDVVVIGSGFSGIGMAVALLRAGWSDVVVLEAAGEVGGTWRDNTYPGAACDIPSHLYSFSFAPNPTWSRSYSPQPEIQDYLVRVATTYDVRRRIRFGHEVTGAEWSESAGHWRVRVRGAGGSSMLAARHLIVGAGALAEPARPRLDGLDTFAGPVWHSARWNHDFELSGQRIGVVGTGASAVQFVPEIAGQVGHLSVFQRTPPWVMPRSDQPIPAWQQRLFRTFPVAQLGWRAAIYWGREAFFFGFRSFRGPGGHRIEIPNPAAAAARRQLERQVLDPDLRARLTPDYAVGCKRILLSNDWYPALQRDNVSVVDAGISSVGRDGITTDDGVFHRLDALVLATGFRATEPPAAAWITGRDGVALREAWSGGMEAYKGTSVAGFPNLWFVVGPNTGLGHNSMIGMIEAQITYIVDGLRQARRTGAEVVEVRRDAQDSWNARLARDLATTVWVRGGCRSWYLDAGGRNTTLWPGFSYQFRASTRRFDPDAYSRA